MAGELAASRERVDRPHARCVEAVLTGALHEDGFADVCDGFGGGTTPERVLAIMKDSRVGAYGAIGVVLMLGLKWTALAALPVALLPPVVVAAHSMSRWVL